jgi:hypothetical protein
MNDQIFSLDQICKNIIKLYQKSDIKSEISLN